jgi:hypothetical protein
MSCEQFGFSFFDDYFDARIDVINDIILIIIQKFARKLLANVNCRRLRDFQIKKYPKFSCGMGVPTRSNIQGGQDAHPTRWIIYFLEIP